MKELEDEFGLISGYYVFELHQLSTAAGSEWEYGKPETMQIVVNSQNADRIYALCKEVRSGYNVVLNNGGMKKIKEAQAEALEYLRKEANDPKTSIERKIELVKLTSRNY